MKRNCRMYYKHRLGLAVCTLIISGILLMLSRITRKEMKAQYGSVSRGDPGHAATSMCNVFASEQSADGDYPCMMMKLIPNVPICIYPANIDVFVSAYLLEEGVWEEKIVNKMQNWLLSDPDMGLIDIGANIGVFSLQAAAIGHDVIAVEPYIENVKRLHKSAILGHTRHLVTIVQNGVSDNRGEIKIVRDPRNQGKTNLRGGREHRSINSKEPLTTQLIHMDDLLPLCNFKQAVLKIDIEGFEHRAFVHAAGLFDKIDIHHVIMEWDYMGKYAKEYNIEEIKIIEKMIDFFTSRHYVSKDWHGNKLDIAKWAEWPDDIFWEKML